MLADGIGKNMKSKKPKVLHEICGMPAIAYALRASSAAEGRKIIVSGFDSGELRTAAADAEIMTYGGLADCINGAGYVLFIAGDAPLIKRETVKRLIDAAENGGCTSFLNGGEGKKSPACCIKGSALSEALSHISGDGFSVSDILDHIKTKYDAKAVQADDPSELIITDGMAELAAAEKAMRARINAVHMENGVRLMDPDCTYIGPDVKIGPDTVVYPGNVITGCSIIGEGCVLYPNNRIENSVIGDGVTLQSSTLLSAEVGDGTTVGPYAYLRPDTKVGKKARIGDFVELKNAKIGDLTRVSHLTYIGDAVVGEDCNFGCGVVFVNYDGKKKYITTVGDRAFVGCNVNLVSPVNIGDDAYIAAGSTVTRDIPAGAFCVARERETVKDGWVEKRREAGKL